jgi:hypothetical protein
VRVLVLAGKDLRVYFRDRAAVLLGFGLPIVLCTVFGAAMGAIGGGGRAVGRIELVVEDADTSDASRALIEALRASDGLRIDLLDADDGDDTARARVAEGDAPAGLLVGAGYGAAVADGAELPLVLYRDPGKTIEQQILAGSLIPAFMDVLGENAGKRMMGRVLDTLDFPEVGRVRAQAILDASWTSMDTLVSELEASGVALDDDVGGDAEEGTTTDRASTSPRGSPTSSGSRSRTSSAAAPRPRRRSARSRRTPSPAWP